MVEGTWGAEPVPGLEAQPGDHIIRKTRMSAWEGTNLETILRAEGRDIIIETGAWTNMSIEHTARTGADKGYVMIIPEDGCSTMNADWHRASIEYAMHERRAGDEGRCRDRGIELKRRTLRHHRACRPHGWGRTPVPSAAASGPPSSWRERIRGGTAPAPRTFSDKGCRKSANSTRVELSGE